MKKLKEYFINFFSQFIKFFIFSHVYIKKSKSNQLKETPVIYLCQQTNNSIDYFIYNTFDINGVFILPEKKFVDHFILNKEYLKFNNSNSFTNILNIFKEKNIFLFSQENNLLNSKENIFSLISFLLREEKEIKIIPISVCYDDPNVWRSHAYIIEGDSFTLTEEDYPLNNEELKDIIYDYLDDISLKHDDLKNKIEYIAYFSTFDSPKEYPNYLLNVKKSDSELINNIYNEIDKINKDIDCKHIERYKNLPIVNLNRQFHPIYDFHYILLSIICLLGFILNLPFLFIQEKIIDYFFKSNIQFVRGLLGLFFVISISFIILIESSFGSLLIYLILSFISLKYSRFSYFKISSFLNDQNISKSTKKVFLKLKYNTFIKFFI